MKETEQDLKRLQALLDGSIEGAGSFLRSSFRMPRHSLSAVQLVRHLGGLNTVAMATVTQKGEPRVAPIGSLLYRGRFHAPTLASAVRTRHLMERPSVSLTRTTRAATWRSSSTVGPSSSPWATRTSGRRKKFSAKQGEAACSSGGRACTCGLRRRGSSPSPGTLNVSPGKRGRLRTEGPFYKASSSRRMRCISSRSVGTLLTTTSHTMS